MRRFYTGLRPPEGQDIFHCPLIRIEPRPLLDPLFEKLAYATHLIFTSQTTVDIFVQYLPNRLLIEGKTWLAVGEKTQSSLHKQRIENVLVPEVETSEGLIELIESLNLKKPYFLWPHSALSRRVIPNYLEQNQHPFFEYVLYDTVTVKPDPLPDLEDFDEIIFTSPSTVQGFIEAYGELPMDKILTPIGPVTKENLLNFKIL
ncbi:MAG: hypothetical protein K940chlam3_00641 [Chlamydiae bacterium]|nr:hypothetical protein [Chlamydiota bacterium]